MFLLKIVKEIGMRCSMIAWHEMIGSILASSAYFACLLDMRGCWKCNLRKLCTSHKNVRMNLSWGLIYEQVIEPYWGYSMIDYLWFPKSFFWIDQQEVMLNLAMTEDDIIQTILSHTVRWPTFSNCGYVRETWLGNNQSATTPRLILNEW
jgi:hypothetical protein